MGLTKDQRCQICGRFTSNESGGGVVGYEGWHAGIIAYDAYCGEHRPPTLAEYFAKKGI